MATFAVTVCRIEIEPHPNADRLELARVGEYRSIVGKDSFHTGDLVAYIPEQSVVPDPLIEEMGLTGRLAGSQANRVKAVRLRGILSQGLCLATRNGWSEGQDVTEELGVIKYEPPIPAHMSGWVYGAGTDRTVRFDVENWKRYPDVIVDGEQVVMTEKIHGTWCQVGVVPDEMAHGKHGTLVVASKGLADRGLAFQPDADANKLNLYLRAVRGHRIADKIRGAFSGKLVFVLGEVFGHGVQDLHYAASTAKDESLGFRVFDIYVGPPAGRWGSVPGRRGARRCVRGDGHRAGAGRVPGSVQPRGHARAHGGSRGRVWQRDAPPGRHRHQAGQGAAG
jgi:RNA ligase (TIGR02306 family)